LTATEVDVQRAAYVRRVLHAEGDPAESGDDDGGA
jgi:hypothetical protein